VKHFQMLHFRESSRPYSQTLDQAGKATDKHSSLLQTLVNCKCKRFYSNGLGVNLVTKCYNCSQTKRLDFWKCTKNFYLV
jgi:hypothetical protein